MGSVLIGGFEPDLADKLTEILRLRRHTVRQVDTVQHAINISNKAASALDLTILDISVCSMESLAFELSDVNESPGGEMRPSVLCISRAFRGAHFELDLERKGARLVHVC